MDGIDLLAQEAKVTGWSVDQQIIAVAIGLAESGGNPIAVSPTGDYGLWQINKEAHPQYSQDFVFDPAGNAQAAYEISGKGSTWTPWTTYTSGAYQQYLDAAKDAVARNANIPYELHPSKEVLAYKNNLGVLNGVPGADKANKLIGSGVPTLSGAAGLLSWINNSANVKRIIMGIMGGIGMIIGIMLMGQVSPANVAGKFTKAAAL